jgi:hypothetical protein
MDNTTLPPIKAGPGIIPPSNSSAASSSSSAAGKLSVRRDRKPVSPRTPSDMIGAQEERDTGLLNPYNLWGPVSKYGYLETVPLHPTQKQHFGGKLVSRKKNTHQPTPSTQQADYQFLLQNSYFAAAPMISPPSSTSLPAFVLQSELQQANRRVSQSCLQKTDAAVALELAVAI